MDLLWLLFFVVFLTFIVATAVTGLKSFRRQFSGRGGRLYADVAADLYGETERRGKIILALAQARADRLAKLERR